MLGRSVYKAGKLLRIVLDYDRESRTINAVRIEGDFFVYPEEGREKLEKALEGAVLDREKLTARIDEALKKGRIEPYGFTGEQLAEAIMQAAVG